MSNSFGNKRFHFEMFACPICISMKYDIEKFKETVKRSESLGHLIELLGRVKAGGNYVVMKQRIKELNLDTSHWNGRKRQGWQRGRYGWRATPLEQILVENTPYKGSTDTLKKRLIREGLFLHKCYDCGNTTWKNVPIPIELEHVNGNRFDCRIDNLTLLCPNCHALTKTYRGKNKGRYAF